MKIGIVVFPGTWSESDTFYATKDILGINTEYIWHKDQKLNNTDLIILPGGFSYGDYLRTGAIASFSPIVNKVKEFANSGGPVIGICNGFQILCETKLLPGILLRNKDLSFVCEWSNLKVNNNSIFTNKFKNDEFSSSITEIHFYHNLIVIKKDFNKEPSNLLTENQFKVKGKSAIGIRKILKQMKYFFQFQLQF